MLKDNDFHRTLHLEQDTATSLIEQLDYDTRFLQTQGIMDYSLLLSIHTTTYIVDQTSVNEEELAEASMKRHSEYAMCHSEVPENEDMEITIEMEERPSKNNIISSRNLEFRYSVLKHEDDHLGNDEVHSPLTSQIMSFSNYSTFAEETSSGTTEWIGTRTLQNPGYQASAVIGPDYYSLGIVDILQTWTLKKQMEHFWKVYVLRYDPNGISAVPPSQYAQRFRQKMRTLMVIPSVRLMTQNNEE